MNTQEENPYRSPKEAKEPETVPRDSQIAAKFCRGAIVVLFCLVVHACVLADYNYFHFRFDKELSDIFGPTLIMGSAGFGFGYSFSAIRHRGYANRTVGILGLLWFGLYALAMVLSTLFFL